MTNPSVRHHYVPEALIRPWVIPGTGIVRGFHWNPWQSKIRFKEGGPKAFCCEDHLLTVRSSTVAPDIIETDFFSPIDSHGAIARDKLVSVGPHGLSDEEKSNLIRLLLSLDVRRPEWVRKLRAYGETLKSLIDADPEVLELATRHRIHQRPSDWFEDLTGVLYEDEALSIIQKAADNPRIGEVLMGCRWSVRTFGRGDPELTLSDRPLLRLGSTLDSRFLWLLPLSPRSLLCIAPSRNIIDRFNSTRPKQVIHETNIGGVLQSDHFVFSREVHGEGGWLAKRLRDRHQQRSIANPDDKGG